MPCRLGRKLLGLCDDVEAQTDREQLQVIAGLQADEVAGALRIDCPHTSSARSKGGPASDRTRAPLS